MEASHLGAAEEPNSDERIFENAAAPEPITGTRVKKASARVQRPVVEMCPVGKVYLDIFTLTWCGSVEGEEAEPESAAPGNQLMLAAVVHPDAPQSDSCLCSFSTLFKSVGFVGRFAFKSSLIKCLKLASGFKRAQ